MCGWAVRSGEPGLNRNPSTEKISTRSQTGISIFRINLKASQIPKLIKGPIKLFRIEPPIPPRPGKLNLALKPELIEITMPFGNPDAVATKSRSATTGEGELYHARPMLCD
jgi:hypothetical protein